MNVIPIIILGSGNSGSGAIKDYLSTRQDIFDPLNGQEFRLIQEKDGLSCLHKSLTSEFHPDKASHAVIQFLELATRLGDSSKKFSFPPKLGYGFASRIPNYENELACFIEDITSCSFKTTTLRDLLTLGPLDWIRYMSGHSPKFTNYEKPIPVSQEVFLERSKELIKRLFFDNQGYPKDKSGYIFDQAGSFWSPVSSTQYFGEQRKVIVVSRDPRDIYSQQINLYGGNASDFVDYYNSVMAHVAHDEWRSTVTLHIEFEKFVLDYDNEQGRLCDFLNISHSVKSKYIPSESMKNIGCYKNNLTREDADLIIKNCVKVGTQ